MDWDFLGFEQGLTVLAGKAEVLELELCRDGVPMDVTGLSFDGVVRGGEGSRYDMVLEQVGEKVGVVRVVLPVLPVGDFKYEVCVAGDDGVWCRLCWGRIGVLDTGLVLSGVAESAGDVRRMRMLLPVGAGGKVQGRWQACHVAEAAAQVAVEAAGKVAAVEEVVERVEAAGRAVESALREFVVPDESTGTWVVGGEDSGKPYKGQDGIDGVKVQRIEVANVEDIPTSGETCNGGYLYYVSGKLADQSDYRLPEGSHIYIHIDREDVAQSIDFSSSIDGRVTLSRSIDDVVADINSWGETWVRAERVNQNTIKVIALSGFVRIDCSGSDSAWMTIYPAYQVYAWITTQNGEQWVNTSETFEAGGVPAASITDVGGVRIVGSVGYGYKNYEIPTNSAIKTYVDSAVDKCAKSADLNGYATKKEVSGLASKSDIAGLATKAALEQVAAQVPANAVTSVFGKRIVELSESEYSRLTEADYEDDVYYFTYEG